MGVAAKKQPRRNAVNGAASAGSSPLVAATKVKKEKVKKVKTEGNGAGTSADRAKAKKTLARVDKTEREGKGGVAVAAEAPEVAVKAEKKDKKAPKKDESEEATVALQPVKTEATRADKKKKEKKENKKRKQEQPVEEHPLTSEAAPTPQLVIKVKKSKAKAAEAALAAGSALDVDDTPASTPGSPMLTIRVKKRKAAVVDGDDAPAAMEETAKRVKQAAAPLALALPRSAKRHNILRRALPRHPAGIANLIEGYEELTGRKPTAKRGRRGADDAAGEGHARGNGSSGVASPPPGASKEEAHAARAARFAGDASFIHPQTRPADWFLEKDYIRPGSEPNMDDVRTFDQLRKALRHVTLKRNRLRTTEEKQRFSWNQLRGIRQDMVIRAESATPKEREFMALVYAVHARVCIKDGDVAGLQICMQQLRTAPGYGTRPIYRAWRIILYALSDAIDVDGIQGELEGLSPAMVGDHHIQHAQRVVAAVATTNLAMLAEAWRRAPSALTQRLIAHLFPKFFKTAYPLFLGACRPNLPMAYLTRVVQHLLPLDTTVPQWLQEEYAAVLTATGDVDCKASLEAFNAKEAERLTRRDFTEYGGRGPIEMNLPVPP